LSYSSFRSSILTLSITLAYYSSLTSSKWTRFFISMHSSSSRNGILTVCFSFSIGSATLVWCDVIMSILSMGIVSAVSVCPRPDSEEQWILTFYVIIYSREKKMIKFLLNIFFLHILGLKWGLICIIQKKTMSQYPKATNGVVDLNSKLFGVWKDNEISLPQHLSEVMFITYRRFWIENVTNSEESSAFYSVIKEFSSFEISDLTLP